MNLLVLSKCIIDAFLVYRNILLEYFGKYLSMSGNSEPAVGRYNKQNSVVREQGCKGEPFVVAVWGGRGQQPFLVSGCDQHCVAGRAAAVGGLRGVGSDLSRQR